MSFLDDSQWFSTIINESLPYLKKIAPEFVILDPLFNEYYQVLLGELINAKPVYELGEFVI